jgi:hypothetical protein
MAKRGQKRAAAPEEESELGHNINAASKIARENRAVEDDSDFIVTEEEQLMYINFPEFEDTTIITNADEIKLFGVLGSNPKCAIANLDFAGKHEMTTGIIYHAIAYCSRCV